MIEGKKDGSTSGLGSLGFLLFRHWRPLLSSIRNLIFSTNLANGQINLICLYSYIGDIFDINLKFGFNSNVGFESINPKMTEKNRSFVKKKLQET